MWLFWESFLTGAINKKTRFFPTHWTWLCSVERLPGGGSRFLEKEAKDMSAFRNSMPSGSRWLSSLLPWRKLLYCWQELFCPEGQTAAWEGCQPGREWRVGRWNYSKLPLRISRRIHPFSKVRRFGTEKVLGNWAKGIMRNKNEANLLSFCSSLIDLIGDIDGGKRWHGGGKRVWFLVWAAMASATSVTGCKAPA